jgi:ATP-dependent Clp protease protease subunit
MISTPGGSVMNGLNLYNVLKGMLFDLTTHNVGNVDSIGNVIFLAGAKRYSTTNATFMFHGVGFNIGNNQRLEEKNVRERLHAIVSDQRRIGSVITTHSTITEDEVAELFLQAQTRDASYAVSKGIVHEIRDVDIPSGAPVISLVFQRQSV